MAVVWVDDIVAAASTEEIRDEFLADFSTSSKGSLKRKVRPLAIPADGAHSAQ